MADEFKPEVNYYPVTINSSTKEGTPDEPQANTPNVADTGTIKESAGSAKVVQNSLQSGNYIKGVAGWLLGSDGIIRAIGVVLSGAITAVSGAIGGWIISATKLSSTSGNIELDSTNETITVGDITIDGAAGDIESDNYVAGVAGAGFHLDSDLLEVGNIRARGAIRTAVFQKDVISSVGGSFAVIDSDVLASDMTALDASTLTIDGDTSFAVGDILRIKDGTDDEWMEVTNIGSAPTYTVTRDKAGVYGADSNPAWKKGATVVNYRQSGDGLVFMTASETNAPFMEVQTHAGSPWSALTARLRIGNLNGFLDYASDLYGIAIGEATKYLKYDPTNGLEIRGQSSVSKNFTANRAVGAGDAVMIGNGTDDYKEAAQETDDATAYTVTNVAWVAQTFTTSNRAVSIKSVTVNGNQNGGGGADTVTVSIRATAAGVPTGADLEGETKTFQTPAGQQDNTVTFDTPIPVDANTVYAIILRTAGGTNYNWRRKDSSVYAGGQAATSANSGSTWTGVSTKDMRFYVNEIETVVGQIDKTTAAQSGDLVNNFIGFAIDDITAGATGPVIISGADDNQTGLTAGEIYYLSDTEGEIDTSAGSVSKKVGLSLSTTEILILNS